MKFGNEWDLWLIGTVWLAWTVIGLIKKLGWVRTGTILALLAAGAFVSWATGLWLEQEALGFPFAFVIAVAMACLYRPVPIVLSDAEQEGKPRAGRKEKADRLRRRERRAPKKRTRCRRSVLAVVQFRCKHESKDKTSK